MTYLRRGRRTIYSDRAALTGASPVDYIVEKCEYAFAIGVPLYVVKMGFWGV